MRHILAIKVLNFSYADEAYEIIFKVA